MRITNANGEVSHTPKSEARELAKKELAELKKANPRSIAEVVKRLEKIEQYLGL